MHLAGGLEQVATFLSCPPRIYDDDLWEKDVLRLGDGESEEALDEQLAKAAKELGIGEPETPSVSDIPDLYTAPSSATISSAYESSVSIQTISTHQTLDSPWRLSKDTQHDSVMQGEPHIERSIAPTPVESRPRPSLTESAYSGEEFMYSEKNDLHAIALANPVRTPPSANSSFTALPTFLSSKKSRKQLAIIRVDIDSPPPTPRSEPLMAVNSYTDASNIKLDCGHSFSEPALKRHIEQCFERDAKKWPSCCDESIPEVTIRKAMSAQELRSLMTGEKSNSRSSRSTTDDTSKLDGLVQTREGLLTVDDQETASSLEPLVHAPVIEAFLLGSPHIDEWYLQRAWEDPKFIELRLQQRDQYQRNRDFEYRQKRALAAHHDTIRWRSLTMHNQATDARKEEHMRSLDDLEEKHTYKESDLRKSQDEERQRIAIRLKHMEAYCGVTPPSPSPASSTASLPSPRRAVTCEDEQRLQRQYFERDNLARKHQSAVNVLRSKQDRVIAAEIAKHTTLLNELDADFRSYLAALEAVRTADEQRLQGLTESRSQRLIHRWKLRMVIWRLEAERATGECWYAKVPQVQWPEPCLREEDLEKDAGRDLDVLRRISLFAG